MIFFFHKLLLYMSCDLDVISFILLPPTIATNSNLLFTYKFPINPKSTNLFHQNTPTMFTKVNYLFKIVNKNDKTLL